MAKSNELNITEVDIGNAVKGMLDETWSAGMKKVEELGMRGGSCDLVYYDDHRVYAFELKKQLNMKVLAQAIRWLDIATGVFIATASPLNDSTRQVLRALGVGYICVRPFYDMLTEKTVLKGVKLLNPQYLVADMTVWNRELELIDKQELLAGSKEGSRSTTFTRFIARAKRFCELHPEATLKMVACQVPNHYSSDDSCMQALRTYAKHGIIDQFWHD